MEYELVIVGGGPAGLTAGIYGARARLKTLLIERGEIGGQVASAEVIENFPGFPDGISGRELSRLMREQAERHGLEILHDEAIGFELSPARKLIKTRRGDIGAKALILALGSTRERLMVPGEEELLGRGVSYCATCDGPLFRGRKVAVIGGGAAAVTEALFLSKFASKVYLVHRRDELRAVKALQEKLFKEDKIEVIWNRVVDEMEGEEILKALKLRDTRSGDIESLPVDGVFIAIGHRPNTEILRNILELTPDGYIPVNERMETNIPGVFACGDVRYNSARQAITACGDGATASIWAERFIRG